MRASTLCILGVVVLLSSCASSTPLAVEKLDPLTGVTVLSATRPLVFYRDNSGYAAHARDYVYLGPIEINRMGARSYYLWLGIWSTMRDDLRQSPQRDGFESVVLYVDGEPFPLEIEGWTPASIGVSEQVYVRPVAGATDAFYRVTADQIRFMATASDIELHTRGAQPAQYRLWDEQAQPSQSLRAFLGRAYD